MIFRKRKVYEKRNLEYDRTYSKFKKILSKLWNLRKRDEFILEYIERRYNLRDLSVLKDIYKKIERLLIISEEDNYRRWHKNQIKRFVETDKYFFRNIPV